MKVKCLLTGPTQEQIKTLGKEYYAYREFGITVGKEYTVLGIQFARHAIAVGTGVWLEIVNDNNHLISVPLCLFEIIDPRVSKYWEFKQLPNNLLLWPSSFYTEYYHDRLTEENNPEILADFLRVKNMIEKEFDPPNTEPPCRCDGFILMKEGHLDKHDFMGKG